MNEKITQIATESWNKHGGKYHFWQLSDLIDTILAASDDTQRIRQLQAVLDMDDAERKALKERIEELHQMNLRQSGTITSVNARNRELEANLDKAKHELGEERVASANRFYDLCNAQNKIEKLEAQLANINPEHGNDSHSEKESGGDGQEGFIYEVAPNPILLSLESALQTAKDISVEKPSHVCRVMKLFAIVTHSDKFEVIKL